MCESVTSSHHHHGHHHDGHHDGTRVLIERMTQEASDWLASLSTDQRRKAVCDFPADDLRTLWYYTPTARAGLPLLEMEPLQQRRAHRLVASGLSGPGYAVASTIMGIENTLDRIEGWNFTFTGIPVPNRGRDPGLYFLAVYGEPGAKSWGWSFGGHHISIHYTIVDGQLATPMPLFFGSNPAETKLVGPGVLRPLAGEEDLGRELLHALDADQTRLALLAPVAPTDILLRNRPKIEYNVPPRGFSPLPDGTRLDAPDTYLEALRFDETPRGIAAAQMTASQREIFQGLLRQYFDRLPEEIADLQAARFTGDAFEGMHFLWAGGRERRQPHYYRIQGPRLLIEYDNTQNDNNHIHSVLRDPVGDFGFDLLAHHYQHAH